MRTLTLALAAALFAAPALAQTPDTLKEATTKGIKVDAQGFVFEVNFTPDGKFTAMDGQLSGTWRIDGDKLCSATEATPEDCALYPKGKKSGDSFEVTGAAGKAMITIK
ncbi:MAG: hypothetical protein RIR33_2100 [Pseudomonadota bacterium]|jgi:hypothetical protein